MKNAPQAIECLILPYRSEFFLMPFAVVAEVLPLERYTTRINTPDYLVGVLPWRGLMLPLLTPDLLGYEFVLQHPKVAIVKSSSTKGHAAPFFALVFENAPWHFQLTPEQIVWIDEEKRKAHLKLQNKSQDVVLLDLPTLSNTAETIYQELGNQSAELKT